MSGGFLSSIALMGFSLSPANAATKDSRFNPSPFVALLALIVALFPAVIRPSVPSLVRRLGQELQVSALAEKIFIPVQANAKY